MARARQRRLFRNSIETFSAMVIKMFPHSTELLAVHTESSIEMAQLLRLTFKKSQFNKKNQVLINEISQTSHFKRKRFNKLIMNTLSRARPFFYNSHVLQINFCYFFLQDWDLDKNMRGDWYQDWQMKDSHNEHQAKI